MRKCLICENEVKFLEDAPNNPDNGGTLVADFGYGSRFDGCDGFRGNTPNPDENRLDRLTSCDIIEAVICDDCFEKKQGFFLGYRLIKVRTTREKVVE